MLDYLLSLHSLLHCHRNLHLFVELSLLLPFLPLLHFFAFVFVFIFNWHFFLGYHPVIYRNQFSRFRLDFPFYLNLSFGLWLFRFPGFILLLALPLRLIVVENIDLLPGSTIYLLIDLFIKFLEVVLEVVLGIQKHVF